MKITTALQSLLFSVTLLMLAPVQAQNTAVIDPAAQPQPQVVPQPQAIPRPAVPQQPVQPPAPPQLSAKSYILMDAATGQVLVENNSQERLPPASLTKLMTAYIATLDINRGQVKMTDMVPISEKAWRMGGSKMFVKVGTQVSLENLLHGIIIQSGNDASVAVAEFLAGSEDSFADIMNRTAQQLGMSNSHFMNATGWPAEGHFSSAYDMALLARAIVYEDQTHYDIYKQKEFLWNNIKQRNRNLLLWRDPRVDGLKTGHTEEAGFCLVASAVENGQRLITAVFGTASEHARAEETMKLLTYGFRFYESRTFYQKNTELAKVKVWKGAQSEVSAGLAQNLSVILPKGQIQNLNASMTLADNLVAPVTQGQVIGKVEVKLGDKVVRTADLVALASVEEGGFFRRLWDGLLLFFRGLFS